MARVASFSDEYEVPDLAVRVTVPEEYVVLAVKAIASETKDSGKVEQKEVA